MSVTAMEILERFRKLSLPERRELVRVLLQEAGNTPGNRAPRQTLNEVLGKFSPKLESGAADHDQWFAEAIMASKRAGENR